MTLLRRGTGDTAEERDGRHCERRRMGDTDKGEGWVTLLRRGTGDSALQCGYHIVSLVTVHCSVVITLYPW